MIDTKELRRLAQAATPGPWQFWHGWVAANIDNDGGVVVAERPTPSGGKYQAKVDANFKFIAAANPATVIELLDHLEAAEKEIESWKGVAKQFGNDADTLRTHLSFAKDELNRLRTKIAEMENQEPVGEVVHT